MIICFNWLFGYLFGSVYNNMKVHACANLIVTNPGCRGWLPWNFCEFDMVAKVFWVVAEWPKKLIALWFSGLFFCFFYCPAKCIHFINQVKNINQVSGQNHMYFIFIFSIVELENIFKKKKRFYFLCIWSYFMSEYLMERKYFIIFKQFFLNIFW